VGTPQRVPHHLKFSKIDSIRGRVVTAD
jgi:hypothetical protein